MKIYTFTDESGQDTEGKLFIVVTVVVVQNEIEELCTLLESIESKTKKRKAKWGKSLQIYRINYINWIVRSLKKSLCTIYVSKCINTKNYRLSMMDHIASILTLYKNYEEFIVTIDSLSKTDCKRFGAYLHRKKFRVSKMRGIKDEASPFIRLADSICGLLRDNKNNDISPLKKLTKKGVYVEI